MKRNLFFSQMTFLFVALFFAFAVNVQAGFLYVLNDDSAGNNIYGYSVNETTGALTLLPNFPMGTGGMGSSNSFSEMLTIDKANNRLYAINDGSDTVSAYSINPATGNLTPLPFSPIALPDGIWGTIAVHPSGSPLIVGDYGFNKSASFKITAATATAAAGSPYSSGFANPYSSAFSQDGGFFYTGGGSGFIFGFSVDTATGVLTPVAGFSMAAGPSPVGLSTDAQGRLFAANTLAGKLRAFTMAATGVLNQAGGSPFDSGLTQTSDTALHPNGNFLVVADRKDNRVGSYQIAGSGSNTTLTAIAGSPFASQGGDTGSLVFNQAGTFLFAMNGGSRNITTYSVNGNTGALNNIDVQLGDANGATGFLTGMDYFDQGITEADLALSLNVSPNPVAPGGTSTYQITLTNNGNITAQNIVLTQNDVFQQRGAAKLTVQSISAPAGFNCQPANPLTDPPMAEVVCRGNLGAGQQAQFTIVKKQQTALKKGVVIYHEAYAGTETDESNTQNNGATDTTVVQ